MMSRSIAFRASTKPGHGLSAAGRTHLPQTLFLQDFETLSENHKNNSGS